MYLHRIAYIHPQTRVMLCAGTTTTPQGRTLIEPRPITDWSGPGGQPFVPLVLPMDEHQEDWLRLQAEWYHTYYPAGHPNHGQTPVGDVRRCIHEGGTPHPERAYVLLPGTFRWTEDPHPRVVEHIEFLRAKSDADLIRHCTGLEPML